MSANFIYITEEISLSFLRSIIEDHPHHFIWNESAEKYCNFVLEKLSLFGNRPKFQGIYYEDHHIFPQSFFPELKKAKWNLVRLTVSEHINAHSLLVEFTVGKTYQKALAALGSFTMNPTGERILTIEEVEIAREANSKALLGILLPESTRNKMSNSRKERTGEDSPFFGHRHTTESRQLMSESQQGKHEGEKNGMWGVEISEERRKELSEWMKKRIEEFGPYIPNEKDKEKMSIGRKRFFQTEEGERQKESLKDLRKENNVCCIECGKEINFINLNLHYLSHFGINPNNSFWVTNGKENKKLTEGQEIPEGFHLGRKIEKLSGGMTVWDIENRTCIWVSKDEYYANKGTKYLAITSKAGKEFKKSHNL